MKDRNWTSANYYWWRIQKEQRDRRQTYRWPQPTWDHKRISKRVSMFTRHQGWHNRDGGVPMALVYSDIKSHFNMPDMTLDNLMEILIVAGKKKARWGFSYDMDLAQVQGGSVFVYPNYTRAVQGHQNIDPRWLNTEELTEDVTGEVYHITDLKKDP